MFVGKRLGGRLFWLLVYALTAVAVLSLAFVIFFIVREALPTFREVGLPEFLLGRRWMPVDYGSGTSFGIFHFILGTLAVSFTAMILAMVVGLGAALWLAYAAPPRALAVLYPLIDLLAGIPSVIYGFVGLVTLVPLFLKAGVHTGTCVLAAAIVLSVMLLPYLVSSCSQTLRKGRARYQPAADALGISPWYTAATMVLPAVWKHILLSVVLASGRAMGETMAVMMVMGNANLFPTLLGKGETIASLIALEMGTAAAGSLHYHALYAAGLVLMVLLLAINGGIALLRRRMLNGEADV